MSQWRSAKARLVLAASPSKGWASGCTREFFEAFLPDCAIAN